MKFLCCANCTNFKLVFSNGDVGKMTGARHCIHSVECNGGNYFAQVKKK